MVFISNVPPAGSGQASNVQPQAMVQAAAAASASPTAQQLLTNAVTATTLVPNYAEPPKPAKATPPKVNAQPSSALAAQMMAQSPELSAEEQAIFAPRQQVTEDGPEPKAELFVQPRMAGAQTPQQEAAAPVFTAKQGASGQEVAVNAALLSQALSTVPAERKATVLAFAVQQSVAGKKSSLTLTRGAAAYALTDHRNGTPLTRANVEAIS